MTLSAEARELYASKNPDIANGKMEAGKVKPKSEMDPECCLLSCKQRHLCFVCLMGGGFCLASLWFGLFVFVLLACLPGCLHTRLLAICCRGC